MSHTDHLNVLFLIQGETTPSTRVRVLDLLPELVRRGIHADVLPFPGGALQRLRVLVRCRRYRAVCIQKKLPSRLFLSLLRRFSRRLLLDFDDAIYRHHSSDPNSRSRTREIRFRRLLEHCDLVVAGNRILAGTARGLAATPVVIVPSAVETRGIPVKGGWNARPVAGWVGGANNLPFLKLWERPLARLARRRPFVLRILSSESIELKGVEVDFVPWSLERQGEEIARFDVGLMPLPDDEHARGKCAYKALQYLAAGVPALVSDVGISGEVVRDGIHGRVAHEPEAVERALAELLDDPEGSLAMGRRGRAWVEAHYSLEVAGGLLADALRRVDDDG